MNFPDKKYKIIYADPPWSYNKYSNSKKETAPNIRVTPYLPMPLEDIKQMQVPEISEKDSVLLLWVTMPCLEWGLEVISAWGFKYKTCGFTWIKKNKKGFGFFRGFGHYTRANTELCLIATRGKILPVLRKNITQIIQTPILKNYAKPDQVKNKIVELFGDLPRIELFARKRTYGWDAWGDDRALYDGPLEEFL